MNNISDETYGNGPLRYPLIAVGLPTPPAMSLPLPRPLRPPPRHLAPPPRPLAPPPRPLEPPLPTMPLPPMPPPPRPLPTPPLSPRLRPLCLGPCWLALYWLGSSFPLALFLDVQLLVLWPEAPH